MGTVVVDDIEHVVLEILSVVASLVHLEPILLVHPCLFVWIVQVG